MSRTLWFVAALAAVALCGGIGSRAADAPDIKELTVKSSPHPTEPGYGAAAIEAALSSTLEADFNEVPLKDVIQYLKENRNIEIQLDTLGIQDAGCKPETPVTIDIKKLPFESALSLILRPLGLTWTIANDVLLITSPAKAESSEFLVTKSYDIADLIACVDEKGRPWDDYATLEEMISKTVASKSWSEAGGTGSMVGATFGSAKIIVVNQTIQVHREIAKLFQDLRAIAAKTPDMGPPHRNPPPPNGAQSGC